MTGRSGPASGARPAKRLTAEQVEQIVRWRELGHSCQSIANRIGVSAGAINYQCLKNGAISPRQVGWTAIGTSASFVGKDKRVFRRFTAEDDVRLRALAAEGLGVAQIADRLDRPRTSVRMRLLLLGAHEDIAEALAERTASCTAMAS